MNENERIVCEFLREISPSREWRYLGEVEHYLIGELCDELNKQLKAENAKLRDELDAAKHDLSLFSERIVELGAENAKLREQIHWLKHGDILHVLTDQEYIDQCERESLMQVSIDALDKENAKLRELIRELFRDFANADYELKSRCGRTFMAVTRYLPRLQELEVEP